MRLSRFHSKFGSYEEEKKSLPLPGIELRLPDGPANSHEEIIGV
jgi:hypothetical protein